MARVKIEDLPVRQNLDKKDMKKIFGGILQSQGSFPLNPIHEINMPNHIAKDLSGLVNAYWDAW